MLQVRHYFIILIISFMCFLTSSKSIFKNDTIDENNALNYLTRYGYLVDKRRTISHNNTYSSNNKTNKNYTISSNKTYGKEEIRLAILEFQKFLGLPLTGIIDSKTSMTMKKPRCGVPDKVPPDYTNMRLKALLTPRGKRKKRLAALYNNRKSVTYTWFIDDAYLGKTHRTIKQFAIQHGINLWSSASNIKFQPRPGWNFADIIFSFHKKQHGDGYDFDGPLGTLAHAFPATKEIHMDDDEDWAILSRHVGYFVRPGKQPDLVQVAAHEMGHVLGIHHSKSNTSVMFPTVSAGVRGAEYALDPEDVARVQATYGTCWPDKIDSIFSNFRGDGRTYIIVGPYIYLFDNQKLSVDLNNWPRPTYYFWGTGFNLIEEIFHGDNDRLYYFYKKWYYFDYYGGLVRFWYNIGITPRSGRVGWPGLNIDKVDAGFKHIDGRVYIFRKDKVYRWDFNAKSPYLPHYPEGQLEAGWPKNISEVFPFVPNDIDTAFRWNYDGKVYFFKGKYFYIWNEKKKRAFGVYSTDQWRNVCDSIKCTATIKCRSWALTPENCGYFCDNGQS